MKTIVAIILAAGESKRMNKPKMLLPFDGKTIIEKVLEKTKKSSINDYIVVVGAYCEEVRKTIGEDVSKCCFNQAYTSGMLSSVQCGIGSIKDGIDAAMIVLGDQPMTGSDIMDKVVDSYRNGRNEIVIPVFNGKRGHPVIIGKQYWKEISHLDPEKGLRELMDRHSDDILEISIPDQVILRDIDTQEDYYRETNHKL